METFKAKPEGALARVDGKGAAIVARAKPAVGRASRKTTPERFSEFIGRPYMRWRDEPDLARMINDRLAAAAPVRIRSD